MGFNFIVEKKARRAAFRKRSSGLLKKAEELSTLCDVDVCLFIVGDGAIDGVHWPTSPSELQRIVGLFHSSHNAMIKKKKKKKRNKKQHPSASASASHSPREMQGMPSLREDLKAAIAEVRERIDHLLLQRETEQLPSSSSALQIQEALDDGNSSSPQSLNLDHDFYGGGGSSSGEGLDVGNSSNLGSQALQSLNLESQQAESHQLLPLPPMVQHLGPICSSSCTTYTDMLLGNGINDDDFDLFFQLPALAGVEADVDDDCTDEIACSSSSLDYTESNSLCWSNSLYYAADQDPVAVTEPSIEFEMMQMASFFPRFLSAQDDAIATIPSTDIEMMDGCCS